MAQVIARNYVIATGGKSRPETGSTGEGFEWMKTIGHQVEESDPALVPVKIKDAWVKKLSGLSFQNAKVTVLQDDKNKKSRTGKIFIHAFWAEWSFDLKPQQRHRGVASVCSSAAAD
jgi:predicted flavoprotein YhiN